MPPLVPTTTIDNLNTPTIVRPEDIVITSQIHPFIISNLDNSTTASSPATTPPLVSPSLLVPLKSSAKPSASSPIRQIGFRDTASQYNQVLEKLESANIQDEQMLSSFKRMSSLEVVVLTARNPQTRQARPVYRPVTYAAA
jgi:hypothetical protein